MPDWYLRNEKKKLFQTGLKSVVLHWTQLGSGDANYTSFIFIDYIEIWAIKPMFSDSLGVYKIMFPEASSDPVFSVVNNGGNTAGVSDTFTLNRRRYSIGTTQPLYIFPVPIISRSMDCGSTAAGPTNLGVEMFFKYLP